MSWFEALDVSGPRPTALVNPFAEGPPHPLALHAATLVMDRLRAGEISPSVPSSVLEGGDGGKMFGVLVAEDASGQLGFLKAFSGKLRQRWDVEGYVPPVFDRALRESTEPRAEQLVRKLTAKIVALRASPKWAGLRERAQALEVKHRAEDAQLRERRAAARAQRRALRTEMSTAATQDLEARAEEVEHRREKARMRAEREPVKQALAAFERSLRRLEEHRVTASRISSRLLYDSYTFENPVGLRRSLRELCAPTEPPSGAGDCAAPKLLVFAQRNGLRPLALAEFWWGAPPRGGSRRQGELYPACAEKCGLVLPFLLGTPTSAEPRLPSAQGARHKQSV